MESCAPALSLRNDPPNQTSVPPPDGPLDVLTNNNNKKKYIRQGWSCFLGVFLVRNPQVEELRGSVVLRSLCRQAGRAPGVSVRW